MGSTRKTTVVVVTEATASAAPVVEEAAAAPGTARLRVEPYGYVLALHLMHVVRYVVAKWRGGDEHAVVELDVERALTALVMGVIHHFFILGAGNVYINLENAGILGATVAMCFACCLLGAMPVWTLAPDPADDEWWW